MYCVQKSGAAGKISQQPRDELGFWCWHDIVLVLTFSYKRLEAFFLSFFIGLHHRFVLSKCRTKFNHSNNAFVKARSR